MGTMIREDKQRMSELYTQIANEIASELPGGWTNMGVCFAVDQNGFETFLVYYSSDCGRTYRDFMEESFEADEPAIGLFEAKESCQKLRELCVKSGDRWTQLALCVNALGEFTADYNYDPIETFTPLMLRLWRGRYLK